MLLDSDLHSQYGSGSRTANIEVPVSIAYFNFFLTCILMRLFFSSLKTCGPGSAEQDKEFQRYWPDSRVYEAILDDYEPHVGGLIPRLAYPLPIQDQLSAFVAPDPDTSPETALFVSDLQDANKI
jgi:hypothetical protein